VKYTLEFEYEKSTKNTHRYQEVQGIEHPTLLQTLYVQKVAFAGKTPAVIYVTITDEEEAE